MTESELKRLLEQRESESIECKASMPSRRVLAEYVVGIGNAGGGWLLVGVTDRLPRRAVLVSAPAQDDLALAQASVADATGVHLTFEVVCTADGPIVVFRIPPRLKGIPLHTNDGKYLIRLGEELRGMTVQEMDAVRREAGVELTAGPVSEPLGILLSASGMEELRRLMVEAGAAPDLRRQGDSDLLHSLGVVTRDGRLTVAGLLLAGKPEAIQAHIPYAACRGRQGTPRTARQ